MPFNHGRFEFLALILRFVRVIIAYFSTFVNNFLHIFSFCMVGILKNPQLGGRGSFKYDLSDCSLPYFFSLLSGLKLCVLIVP